MMPNLDEKALKCRKGVQLAFKTIGPKSTDKIIQYVVTHPHATLQDFDNNYKSH